MHFLVLNWQDRENPLAGGAESHLHEVFGRMARQGHRVTLVCSRWAGAPREAVVDGLDVVRVGGRHSYPVAAVREARRRLARERIDLVVEDLNKVPLFTPLWSAAKTVLLVHHLFGSTAFRSASVPVAVATWLLERPIPPIYRRIPVQTVSESTRQDLVRRGLDRHRIHVVPNGVDTSFFAPALEVPREREPTFLVLGRLQPYKRVDLPIEAFARWVEGGGHGSLWIAGTGPALSSLERLRDRLGLGARVEFLGYVSETRKRDLLRRAHAHIFTSPKEGWGITNLEAGACGTMTIASDSPGLRDSVVDRRTGLLVPHGDVGALSAAMAEIAADGGLRERLGAGARRFAERHSWEATADAALAHFTAIVEGTIR